MSVLRLHQLHHVGRAANHLLGWQDDRPVYWGDYHARVVSLSRHLAAQDGKEWLLACPDPFDFTIGLFALWHAGKVALVPPSLRPGALEEVSATVAGILSADSPQLRTPADAALAQVALPALNPHEARLDLFTSGSSGEPKRIPKKLAQLDAEVAVLEQVWGQQAGPALATVPHHHIYGLLFRLLWPLSAGRPLDAETCATPEQLLARLEKVGPAMVISSPSQLSRMHELIDLRQLAGRAQPIFSSGGPLPATAAGRFKDALGASPLEIYGSTETGGIAWRQQSGEDDDSVTWTPQVGVSVDIAADGGLSLTSPFLFDTQAAITGDAAYWQADGRFRLLGRLDRIVKIEEKRLSLTDMEEHLRRHAWVKEAATVVLPGRRQRLGAVLVLSTVGEAQLASLGRHAYAQQLRQHLSHWFDTVLLPRHWRYLPALPYNERGKLAAADLQAMFNTEPGHD